jgi:hypothetical protein
MEISVNRIHMHFQQVGYSNGIQTASVEQDRFGTAALPSCQWAFQQTVQLANLFCLWLANCQGAGHD